MRRRSRICLFGCALGAMLPLVTAAPANPDAGLDRLFTTPAERALIDRLRGMSSLPAGAITTDPELAPWSPADTGAHAALHLKGMVQRSDGREELWLDGGHTGTTGGTDAQNRVPVQVPGSGHRVWMKPGQVLDTATGTVRESYQAGHAGP